MNQAENTTRLSVAEGPHWRDGSTLAGTQLIWVIALLPAAVAGVVTFGWPALRVLGLAVGASVLTDLLAERLAPSRDFSENGSSVSLGLLLAFLLPVNAPWWLVVTGAVVTIVFGKKLYGGWGAYPVHPVALGYAMLALSWPARLDHTAALVQHDWSVMAVEPTRLLRSQGAMAGDAYSWSDLFMGQQVAGVAGGMVLWLLLGGLLLVLVRVVPWQIPLGCVAGILGGAWLTGLMVPEQAAGGVFQLLAGTSMLMAFFLLGESTTSPVNSWPMLLYGLLGGLLLVLIRTFSIHAEAAVFAVLLVNLANPLLDRLTPGARGLEVSDHA